MQEQKKIGDMIPSFLISETEYVVVPLTHDTGHGHSLGMKMTVEMGRNKESSAHLHTMLFY